MPAPKDITGMRFGNLVAIEKVDSRGGHTYWRFRCDCGEEKEIMTCNVIGGLVKSCGCLFNSISNFNGGNLLDDPNERVCVICEKHFFGFIGDVRVYCYDCSPYGATVADAKRAQKRSIKHLLVEYKGGKCIDCGYDKCEGALQFHHINGNDKDFTLSKVKPNEIPMSELYKEVDKCVLLCANCHTKKHVIDDKIGFVMNLPPAESLIYQTRQCRACNSKFTPNNLNRYYCYECVPYGIDQTTAKRLRKKSVKHELLKYRGDSCFYCGYNDCESSLHFHHRNPEDKEFEISKAKLDGTNFTMEKLKAEVDKCNVLCANCHAEVHYDNGDDEPELY